MRASLLCLFALCAAAAANPVMEFYFSEIQAAPDSLERLELHPINVHLPLPLDLYGWQLQTTAGLCTVQAHVTIADSTSYAVLDRTNLGPRFALGDESDSLVLFDETGDFVTDLGFPSIWDQCLAPPPGSSVALYHTWIWRYPDPIEVSCWYIDATPTFGSANDDTDGGIRGRVVDDRGLPVVGAWTTASGPTGSLSYGYTDTAGRFEFHPTGPGTYEIGASCAGHYSGFYPDSVTVGTNEWADSINIAIVRTGIAETQATLVAHGVALRGRTLLLGAPGRVTVFDLSGRPVVRSTARAISLAALPSGIYFVRLESVAGVLNRKVVLF
jgi:hypothetical protein